MLTNLTNLFTKPKPATDGWQDPVLARLREEQQRGADHLADLERRWAALEARTDYTADQQREQLRAQLPAAYQARDVLALRITAAEEREVLLSRELMPLYEQKRGLLERRFEALSLTVEAPSDDEFLAFVGLNRELEQIRSVLQAETGLPEYQRPFDAVQLLKGAWFDQTHARMRLFDRVLGPGSRGRIRGEAPPWQGTLRRLSELKACLKGVADAR